MSPRRPVGPTGPLEIGVKLTLHPQDRTNWIHVQRSDDGTTGTIEREWEVPGTQGELLDRRAPTKDGKYYRTRGIGTNDCTDPSPWSNWRKARATVSGTRPTPRNPVGREVPHRPGSNFNLEQKTNLIGQLSTIGSTDSLNLRSDDPSGGDGVVRIQWDACAFKNGGETIEIGSGKSTEADPNTTYWLYHSAEKGEELTTKNHDNVADWPNMQLGSVTTVSDGSTGSNVGTTDGQF